MTRTPIRRRRALAAAVLAIGVIPGLARAEDRPMVYLPKLGPVSLSHFAAGGIPDDTVDCLDADPGYVFSTRYPAFLEIFVSAHSTVEAKSEITKDGTHLCVRWHGVPLDKRLSTSVKARVRSLEEKPAEAAPAAAPPVEEPIKAYRPVASLGYPGINGNDITSCVDISDDDAKAGWRIKPGSGHFDHTKPIGNTAAPVWTAYESPRWYCVTFSSRGTDKTIQHGSNGIALATRIKP